MNTRLFIFIYIFIFVVVCSGYQFTGNLSEQAIKDNKWSYQYTLAYDVDLPPLWLGGAFIAGSFSGGTLNGEATVNAGCAYIVIGGLPIAFLAYFDAKYNTTLDPGQGFASMDVSAAAGFIGTAVLWLEERNPNSNNSLVNTVELSWQLNIANDAGLSYTLSETSQATDDIQYVTFSGTSNDENSNLAVDITYMATRVAGIVGGGGVQNVPVVPGSIESIVEINNYPYQSTQNYLNLVLAVATGSADVTSSGQTVHDSGKQVYFSVSKNAYVGGNQVSVNVSGFVEGTFDDVDNSDFQAQVSQKYGAQAVIKLVTVSFPAGASNIVYDPSIGSGVSVIDASQGSSSLVSPLLSLVLFLTACLVF